MRFKSTDALDIQVCRYKFYFARRKNFTRAEEISGTTFASARFLGRRYSMISPSRPAEMFKRNRGVRGPGRMKVKELRPESKVDVIELTIRQKGETRDFSSRSGSTGKVADAKAVDDEGTEVSVSLWNDEIERVQANDRIRITNGWVGEWRRNLQLSAGRYGKLEVLR